MRDRDPSGRPRNARPRDELGRPLPPGHEGVAPLPEDIDTSPAAVVALADRLLDKGMPFQAHEALEAAWKSAPDHQRPAWQALAQLAVALTHCRRGNAVGASRVRARALVNLGDGELPQTAWALRDRLLEMTEGC